MNYYQRPTFQTNAVNTIIGINILVFIFSSVFTFPNGESLNEIAGLYNFRSDHFQPFQLITHMFLHGNLMHIFFNMFALWMFGSVLERYWGSQRFLFYYFVTGIGAAFLHLLVSNLMVNDIYTDFLAYQTNPSYDAFEAFSDKYLPMARENSIVNDFMVSWDQQRSNPFLVQQSIEFANEIFQLRLNIPTVGASGAVFGQLLAFGMLFPNTVLMLLFPPIPIKAKYFVMGYGAIELYLGLRDNVNDNVAHFAHLGGMLFGFLLIKYWQKTLRNRMY